MLQAIHHVQITVAPEQVSQARDFYLNVMGLQELPKPASLQKNGGFWCQLGAVQIHIGLEASEARQNTKAHLAYAVSDLALWRSNMITAGLNPLESTSIPGMDRFVCRDPFGNRMEFLKLKPST